MNFKAFSRFSAVVLFFLAFVLIAAAPVSAEAPVPAAPSLDDDAASAGVEDSIYREELGQDFSSLFEDDSAVVDTLFAWSNSTINSGRFDYKTLGPEDTIKIALSDSALNRSFVHPFSNYVTSRFGPRRYLWHYGTDVKLNTGDTVRAAFDGIVRVIQYDRRGYGNVAVVRHHSGLETLYGHLSKIRVEPNQRVKAGDMVGLGGNTGRSTGAHLHFEFRYFGEPFSPEYIIDFEKYALKSDTLVLTRSNFEYLTELRKTVYHTVRRGDNLGGIARRYGTSVNSLCRLNGITSRTTLWVGRKLVVRSGKEAEKQVVSSQPPADSLIADAAASPSIPSGASTVSEMLTLPPSGAETDGADAKTSVDGAMLRPNEPETEKSVASGPLEVGGE